MKIDPIKKIHERHRRGVLKSDMEAWRLRLERKFQVRQPRVGFASDAAPRILTAEPKPLPKAREAELVEFLKAMKPTNEEADQMAAEKHFHARITRERFRKARALAGVKGAPGRPRKDH
jgi:hypothetical protein